MATEVETHNFHVSVCRKVSTQENERDGVTIYAGQAPITSFLDIPDEENVRKYTLDVNERKRMSGVHRAILDTLENSPEKLSILSGGICITANKADLSSNQKSIRLFQPNIINGSQTRGVIRDFINSPYFKDLEDVPNIRFEILVTDNADLITEASIARNNQIAVKSISIMGARDVFEELGQRVETESEGKKLRKSETDRGDEYIATEKLLQVIAALIPKTLWEGTGKSGFNKAFSYTGQAGPLKLFEKIHNEAKGIVEVSSKQRQAAERLYAFYLDIAPEALALYEKWQSGKPFEGKNWRQDEAVVRHKETNKIIRVHDGVIFPILAAHSAFIVEEKGKWKLKIPAICDDSRLVEVAHGAFNNIAKNKPHLMGRTEACYSQILVLTDTLQSVMK